MMLEPIVTAGIPSPSQSVWYLGPLPLRAYAIAILVGIVVALWMTTRRYVARGGSADAVLDLAFWAVPFGIVGGRIYHVISTPDPYWGPDGDPMRALAIWEGGMGIWGAIAFGAVGAWIATRRAGVRFAPLADAAAPGILIAQAIGRLGNWFNQELFGAPTTLPWGLQIDPSAAAFPADLPADTLFHPTFLYELLWNLAAAAVLIWADRRFRLGHGQVFWAYVFSYSLGRVWIEMLRIDEAELVLGVRLNVWTAILTGVGSLIAFLVVRRLRPGREDSLVLHPETDATEHSVDERLAGQDVGDEHPDGEVSGDGDDGAHAAT